MFPSIPPARETSPGLSFNEMYPGRQGSRGISPAPPQSRGTLFPPQPPVVSPSPPQSHEYVGRQGPRGISSAPPESYGSLAPPHLPGVSSSPPQSRGYFGRLQLRGISSAPPESRGSTAPPLSPGTPQYVGRQQTRPMSPESRGFLAPQPHGMSPSPIGPPSPSRFFPGPSRFLPGPSRSSPGPSGLSPGQSGLSPGMSGFSPGPSGLSPGPSRSSPGPSRFFPVPSRFSSGPSGLSPGPSRSTPGPSGLSPGPSRSTPGPRGLSPGPSGLSPGPSGLSPGPSRSSPGPSGLSPGQSGLSPGPSGFSPGPSGLSPGPSRSSPGPSRFFPVPSRFSSGPSGLSPGPSGLSPGPSRFTPGPSGLSPGPSKIYPGPRGYFAPSQPRGMPPGYPEPPPGIYPGPQNEPAAYYTPSQVDAPVSFVYEPRHPTGGGGMPFGPRSVPPTPSPWATAEENPPHQGFSSWPSTPEPIYSRNPQTPRGPRVQPAPVFYLPLGHTVDPPPADSVDPPPPPKQEPLSLWPPGWWSKTTPRTPQVHTRYNAADPDHMPYSFDRVRSHIQNDSDVDLPVYIPEEGRIEEEFDPQEQDSYIEYDEHDDFHSRPRLDSYYIPLEYQSRPRGSSFLIPPEYRDLRPEDKPEGWSTGTLIAVFLCVLVLIAIAFGLYFTLNPEEDELGGDVNAGSGTQHGNGSERVHTYFRKYCSNPTRRKRAWVVEYDDENRADDIGRKAMTPESIGGTLDDIHGRHSRYARNEGKLYNTSINAYWMDGYEEGSAIADAASSNSGTKGDTDLRKNGAREGIINASTMEDGNIKVKHQVVQTPGVGKASVGTSQTMQAPKRSDSFTWSNSSVDETGVADDDGRSFITGGVRAQCSQHPYAAIIRNRAGTVICSGTLVDNKHVLTTASCFMKNKTRTQAGMNTTDLVPHADNYTVYLGYLTLNFSCMTNPVTRAVKFVYVHSMNEYHDIALVRLAREIPMSDSVRPVCLAGSQDVMSYKTCQAVGFGISNASSEAALRQAPNAIWLTWGDCLRSDEISGLIRAQLPSRVNASFNKYMEDKLCSLVGDNGTGLCEGDVGGQLLCDSVVRREQKLFGIHLPVTDQCGKPGSLLLGTSVQYHLVWLEFVAVRFLNDMCRNDTETLINYNCRFSYCKDHLKAAIDEASRKTRESHDASTDPGANEPAMDVDDLVNTHRRPREANPPGSLTTDDLCRWYVAFYQCRGIGSPKSEVICNMMDRTVTPGLIDAFGIILHKFIYEGRRIYCAPPTTTQRPRG